jgi:hypothetical protein
MFVQDGFLYLIDQAQINSVRIGMSPLSDHPTQPVCPPNFAL